MKIQENVRGITKATLFFSLIALISIIIAFVAIWISPPNNSSVSAEKTSANIMPPAKEVIARWLNATATIGNHTYVPIYIKDLGLTESDLFEEIPSNYCLAILRVIDDFEKLHPELIVPAGAWQIEKRDYEHGHHRAKILGLWIDHLPNPTYLEPAAAEVVPTGPAPTEPTPGQ